MLVIVAETAGTFSVVALRELVKAVARVEGLQEAKVGLFARAAREAGHIAQAGRGRGAAQMSARDAVNLLIAVNGCPLAKNVKAWLPVYRALPWSESDAHWRLPQKHRRLRNLFLNSSLNFGEWLEQLIELAKPESDGSTQLSRILDTLVTPADANRAERAKLRLPFPALDFRFWAARPSVECAVRIPKTWRVANSDYRIDSPVAATVLFEADTPSERSPFPGDRAEAVIITDATITWVSEVLQNGGTV